MKNSKGFTLTELIIAIGLLAVVGLVIGLNYNKIFNKTNDDEIANFNNKMKSATDVYLANNNELISALYTNKGFILIKAGDLKKAGLIDDNMINPETKEVVSDEEIIMVSLDDAGVVKFTYPVKTLEEHLQALNREINYDEEFICLDDDLDTIKFGLISKEGNLVENYFKNNPEKITCKTETINTKKLGLHVVKYSYITEAGITKEGARNYLVVDHIMPIILNVSATPTIWTNGNVTIQADVRDDESGLDSYSISKEECESFQKITGNKINHDVNENGLYKICVKDKGGNIAEEQINVANIDKTGPTYTVTGNPTSLTLSAVLTVVGAYDNEVGLHETPYSFDNGISWQADATKKFVSNQSVNIRVRDSLGNYTSKEEKITMIKPVAVTLVNTSIAADSIVVKANVNSGHTIRGYQFSINNGAYSSEQASPNYTYRSLTPNTTYNLKVRAITTDGVAGESAIINVRTLNEITTTMTITCESTSVSCTKTGSISLTGIKSIKSVTTNYGRVLSSSLSGTTVTVNVDNGSEPYNNGAFSDKGKGQVYVNMWCPPGNWLHHWDDYAEGLYCYKIWPYPDGERIPAIITGSGHTCGVGGNGHNEYWNKGYSCTVGFVWVTTMKYRFVWTVTITYTV